MKEYKLEIDPRILELLGPSLYSNIYYVLAELIANAYDADAQNVWIIASDDEIRVEDDGRGMSYSNGEVAQYLNVAGPSRTSEKDAVTSRGRRRMGRKGVGKLAALSVSADVEVLTVSQGERSGFILSREPNEGELLAPIPDDAIIFEYVDDHGSAIVMKSPQYQLHKTQSVVRRNISKMFPLVSKEFRIHIVRDGVFDTLDGFDDTVMRDLSTLITLGDDYRRLAGLVPNPYPAERDKLVSSREAVTRPVTVANKSGVEREYTLEIKGWIGTYKSTTNRKSTLTDFPDNFISLFANGKLGEFNILPLVGQNKLSEVYVVGQLHVDLFELTELPDMALSNRQGYKSDDPRYQELLMYVRKELLADSRRRRDLFGQLTKSQKAESKIARQRQDEAEFRVAVDEFRRDVSRSTAETISTTATLTTAASIEEALDRSINRHVGHLGIKSKIDAQKKKILISHTSADSDFADIIFDMLIFNGAVPDDILYSSSANSVCRIPNGVPIYEYLRDFFVDSYSTQKLTVLFATSDKMAASWGAVSEVGASWITQMHHEVFNLSPFTPIKPLNADAVWQTTHYDDDTDAFSMDAINMDVFCVKIEDVCALHGYAVRSRTDNMAHLKRLIESR
ncbi:ATP-binding protein [Clavibacter michiganensis]|uniref:ATP-binding protein n=1 Tax=Clavibacter michiganensis TaxID=28447 RepID=A0A251YUJ5_9MICO|nr:ATP-binding protein [Clavibacter michiganensis]OUE27875.1 hypothetical protein BFL37_00860 [Clavibacter michiganensis]